MRRHGCKKASCSTSARFLYHAHVVGWLVVTLEQKFLLHKKERSDPRLHTVGVRLFTVFVLGASLCISKYLVVFFFVTCFFWEGGGSPASLACIAF